ncbi:hypothetical protein Taro_007210 [Colocasia esculenta]|uniref:Uncharacterized protein n=1 Tax=Colocasia esculenta TaxID=4460 RepID=A0A843TZ53_COLES|nr:hypothetical protein [Colocasia esculenta]
MSFCHVLGAAGLKPKAAPLSPSRPLSSLSPLSFPSRVSLMDSWWFLVLEAFVLRWCHSRSCRGRVRVVWSEEEASLPTRRPQQVRLLSSDMAHPGRRRRGDRRGETSQQRQGAPRAEETGRK